MTETNDQRPESYRESLRLLHAGRASHAAMILEELYESAPNDAEVALHLGGAYILLERHGEALEILERAAIVAPENPNVWINLGAARLGPLESSSAEQKARAVEAYEQALAVHPEAPNVHYMLGLIHRANQDNNRAAAHFARAIEHDPDDRDAKLMLRAIARESGT